MNIERLEARVGNISAFLNDLRKMVERAKALEILSDELIDAVESARECFSAACVELEMAEKDCK